MYALHKNPTVLGFGMESKWQGEKDIQEVKNEVEEIVQLDCKVL